MRLTPLNLRAIYLIDNKTPKNGRRAACTPFPFNGCLPLTLRDHVSGKGDKQQSNACLQEMAIMFACFKKNDFSQAACSKEIDTFQACHLNHMITESKKKDQELNSLMPHGERRLNHKQLNQLLRKYRQPQ
ncbi:coiled-coil-helix-coiled-coil-helix domain-containing protein 1-like [Eriocheir sinensis]|uniref:coiled-coil-helix-coiled-coil-helix domain-containing protein 1-like n=1 Tax=Eriocheir sinensis TaxID=95602 RepID=UPI0021C5EFB9|nr:coiled-coil-helix-coiled-coil-helix domain-containing protein 1-like [Eriocheir sinensis]